MSDWVTIDQERITAFAEATDDLQWIHVDPERAARGPFGRTIAHGYLVLSLLPKLMEAILTIPDAVAGVNYGVDRLRFVTPVLCDSRVRLKASLAAAEQRGPGVLVRLGVEFELEGSERPAAAGEVLFLAFA